MKLMDSIAFGLRPPIAQTIALDATQHTPKTGKFPDIGRIETGGRALRLALFAGTVLSLIPNSSVGRADAFHMNATSSGK